MAYIKEEIYDEQTTAAIAEHYREILRLLGEDPEREGLVKTPERVAKALQFLTHGSQQDGAEILRSIGVTQMRLITNNPIKRVGLESYGLSVVENVGIEITPNQYNERYLKTKKDRMGHNLHFNK